MAELKTQATDDSVEVFLSKVDDETRREDCRAVMAIMEAVTGDGPVMWGGSIIGFGRYHYVYDSGREGDWFLAGVAPRRQSLSIYVMAGFDGYDDLMSRLGNYRTGKSCLYVKRLADIDAGVLHDLVERSVTETRARYP